MFWLVYLLRPILISNLSLFSTRRFTEFLEVSIEHFDGCGIPTGDAYSSDTLSRPIWDLHIFYLLRLILFPSKSFFFWTIIDKFYFAPISVYFSTLYVVFLYSDLDDILWITEKYSNIYNFSVIYSYKTSIRLMLDIAFSPDRSCLKNDVSAQARHYNDMWSLEPLLNPT